MKNVPALHTACAHSLGRFFLSLKNYCGNTCKLKTGSSKIFIMSTLFDIVCMFGFCGFQLCELVSLRVSACVLYDRVCFLVICLYHIIILVFCVCKDKYIYIQTHIIVAVFAFEVFVFFLCFFSMQ